MYMKEKIKKMLAEMSQSWVNRFSWCLWRIWVDLKLLKWPNYSDPSQMQCIFMWLCGSLILRRTHKLTFWFTWICSFVRRRTTGSVGAIRMVGHWDATLVHSNLLKEELHLSKKGICHLILKRCRSLWQVITSFFEIWGYSWRIPES